MSGAMKLARRKFLHLAAGAAAVPAVSCVARAQAYPTRPITMIVPYAAGAGSELVGRVLAERMRVSLGQPVIVANVTGAGGSIGPGRVAHARPDGYTLDLGLMGTHVLNGALYSLQYDVLNDFAPISPLASYPNLLVARKTIPARDIRELIAWLKANPNKASAGIGGGTFHLLAALFQKETATTFSLVPYRGVALARQDLIAGQIDLSFEVPEVLSQLRAGNMKAYAVTSEARLAQLPDIPTFAEIGLPSLSLSNWYGLFAPKGTPGEIIAKLNAAVVVALADPAMRSRLVEIEMHLFPREQQTPEVLGAMVKADAAKWWPIIKEFGIKAE
jgi:tripartite-type tricarboxylate transporter receptor subunit TctC